MAALGASEQKGVVMWLGMVALCVAAKGFAVAGEPGEWCAQLHVGVVAPTGSLSNWFAPSERLVGVQVGLWQREGWSWRVGVEFLELAKENTARLYYRDLDLHFASSSATVRGSYVLASWRGVQVFAGGGVGLHHWRGRRGAYQLAEVFVPARDQEEWSWAFEGGIGAHMALAWRVSLMVETVYRLVVGELWPALALRLENVSGLQSFFCTLGLQIAF